MTALLRLLAGLAAGAAIAIAVAVPASAADESHVKVSADVTGQAWSAPAYPVTCQQEQKLVSCTPTDPGQVHEQACYLHVLLAGDAVTVCTTYPGHADALKAAGGRTATVEFGCSFGDVVCSTFETVGRGSALLATSLMYSVLTATSFDVGGNLWTAAVDQWSFWAWATLIIVFIAMVWAVTAAAISGQRDQIVGALLRSFLAIPAVPLTLWLTGSAVQSVDALTGYLIRERSGPAGLFTALQSVMWAGGQAGYVFGVVILGLVLVGMLLFLIVFLFRNIALAALIMVGPIAWMVFPARSVGPQWVVRYVSAVVVLLLTGPLTIAFFSLVVDGLSTVHTIWDPAAWPYLAGLVLIAFAPFAVFGLFTFVGAVAVDSIGSRLGSNAAGIGSRAVRSVAAVPTRLGAKPSGTRPSGRPPAGPGAPPRTRSTGGPSAPAARPRPAPTQPRTPSDSGSQPSPTPASPRGDVRPEGARS